MKLLNVDSLSVSYSHIPTVKDISFSISPGEIVGLVGESGCGKSTLLRTLMMLMEENCQIDKGAVFFEETDLTKLSPLTSWERYCNDISECSFIQ